MAAGKMALRDLAFAFVLLTVSYWLLAGQVSPHEIALALVGGAFTALWAAALSRVSGTRFRFEWKAVVTLMNAFASVPQAAARIGLVLLRARHRPRGSIVYQPFDHGHERDAADATRRAVVLLATSLAPDKFALLDEGDHLCLHRLGAGPPSGDAQWPA